MLPRATIPRSLEVLLEEFRPCFTAPTLRTFTGLAVGLIAATRRRTVCGMLLGAGLERVWHHSRAHRFFALARWSARGVGVGVLGGVLIFLGLNIPFNGLLFLGIGLLVAGIAIVVIGRQMPSVTLPGAMIRAMMAAYRRTLRKTMDQARSMDQVVAEAGLPWLETPDQAVVWATALGLHREIETVLERSLEDEREGRVSAGSVWMPAWYGSGSGSNAGFAGAGAGGGGGGLFSSSAVPNIGGL